MLKNNRTITLRLLIWLILMQFSHLHAKSIEFLEPSQRKAMPSGSSWKARTVKYEKSLSDVDIYITLDQQQYPILKPMIENYAKQHSLLIHVSDGTCGVSAGLLRKKSVDIGGYCCPPGKLDRLAGLEFHTIGIMSLAIITNVSVPVDDITREQAEKIFKGEITDWKTLNSNSVHQKITSIIRPHCKKRPGHWRNLVSDYKKFSKKATKVGSIQDMLHYTAKKKFTIGYETPWMVKKFGKNLKLKILTIDGVSPNDVEALADNRYPLYRTYNVTTWQDAAYKQQAYDLVQWLIKNTHSTSDYNIVNAASLKQHHWLFEDDELIASPKMRLHGRRQ